MSNEALHPPIDSSGAQQLLQKEYLKAEVFFQTLNTKWIDEVQKYTVKTCTLTEKSQIHLSAFYCAASKADSLTAHRRG